MYVRIKQFPRHLTVLYGLVDSDVSDAAAGLGCPRLEFVVKADVAEFRRTSTTLDVLW